MNLKLLKLGKILHIITKDEYNIRRQVEFIKRSGLFDEKYYLTKYPDVKNAAIDPIVHYVKYGWKEGKNPNYYFETKYYLENNLDVKQSGINPFIHFLKHGKKENRLIHAIQISNNFDRKISNYPALKEGIIDFDTIKSIIKLPSIKVVSFDIFDTLLVRPCIKPQDIFYIIDAKLKKEHNIDFLKYRLDAEVKLGKKNATFNQIYEFIRSEYGLKKTLIEIMKKEELACEEQLLFRREDVYNLYLYALEQKKKVIVTSDMYLSSEFLRNILFKNGYKNISSIYVSNEWLARKDDGTLFKILKNQEQTDLILHIGDNFHSDFKMAQNNNITAIYYPSILHTVFSNKLYKQVYFNGVSPDPICRSIIAFTINRYFSDFRKIKDNHNTVFEDFSSFVKLGLCPILFYIVHSISNNQNIQKSYKRVLFASRDGYLPKLCYDIYSKFLKVVPSEYIYAGRRAYFSSQTKNFLDYVQNISVDKHAIYTIKNLLDSVLIDEKLKKEIISSLTQEESCLDLNKDRFLVIRTLKKYKKKLDLYLQKHKKEALNYYNKIKGNEKRLVVFDCGYSGSISEALGNILNKYVDKIYLWETNTNKKKDIQNGTHTFTLMHEDQLFLGCNLIYEELFSPLCGGCIGFSDGKPIIEKIYFDSKMKNNFKTIKKEVSSYMQEICSLFKPYLKYLELYDTFALQRMLMYGIKESPFNEINLLDNINFPDSAYLAESESLSYKIQKYSHLNTSLLNTGFLVPQKDILVQNNQVQKNINIGIHIHMYNIYLYQEVLKMLVNFPQEFDLYITICDSNKEKILKNIFSKNTIKKLRNLSIITVENRGRDVAPWLINLKKIQFQYDFFCHIHCKESSYWQDGSSWRKYLFDNLISEDVVNNILTIFLQNPKVGIIFPKMFPPLFEMCSNLNINMMGEDGEEYLIQNLCKEMKIPQLTNSHIYHSCGTMFWYRPQALQKMFDLNLDLSDFPAEPIGKGGTLAHAIERLPVFVCENAKFQAMEYTPHVWKE